MHLRGTTRIDVKEASSKSKISLYFPYRSGNSPETGSTKMQDSIFGQRVLCAARRVNGHSSIPPSPPTSLISEG